MDVMTEVMRIIKSKLHKNVLSERLDQAMETPEAQEFIKKKGSSDRLDSITARLTAIDKARKGDDLSMAITELCEFLDISHTTFMMIYASRFDTFGKSLFLAHEPATRDLIAFKIRADLSSLRKEKGKEAAAELEKFKDIIWEIFSYLTHGLSDPATIDGECRVSLIIALNPVSVGPFSLREELGQPEFNGMSADERDAVLSQYPSSLLKSHAEIILWTLQALEQEKKFPAAKYEMKIVEDFLNNLNTTPQGGITNVPGPGSSQATPIL